MALDRLRFHSILVQEMSAPTETAERLAEVVAQATDEAVTDEQFQTRMDLTEARLLADHRAEINRLLKWMVGLGVAVGGGLIAVMGMLVAKL
ncbi:MAG: hypothetical protein F4038_07190 [Chloroflexi bacterium]|nr:hypothetical protein [Chloroflexota bacterium]MYJ92818.1 hypothetical protein [Chloroflexota bacterium]